jgi:uncharacterized RDD family membrane protein YckC
MTSEKRTYSAPSEGAGILIRGAARFIDLIIVNVLALITLLAFGSVLIASGASPESFGNNWLLQLVGGFASMTAYHTLCEGLYGATIGKLLFSLVVIKEDGTPCETRAAFTRSMGMLADGLFFGLIGVMIMRQSPKRKRRGDKQAGTMVVRRSQLADGQFQPHYPLASALPSAIGLTTLVCVVWLILDAKA